MIPFSLRSIWLSGGALVAGALTLGRLIGPGSALTPPLASVVSAPAPEPAVADSIVALGLRLRGRDYRTGGTTPEGGFDCSGFVRYCFAQRGVAVPPSSTLQAQAGREVPRAEARPGDIIIFTGTDAGQRSPGHTGIVISQPGEALRFVHSSSSRKEPGVKVSQVDSTRYEERYLTVRRVIEDTTTIHPAPVLAAVPAPEAPPVPEPAIAPLPPVMPTVVVPARPAPVQARQVQHRRAAARPATRRPGVRPGVRHSKSRAVKSKKASKKPVARARRAR